jgi:hypothetical protein
MKNIVAFLIGLTIVACNNGCVQTPSPSPVPTPSPPAPTVVVDAGPVPTPVDADAGPDFPVTPGVRLACDQLYKVGCGEAASLSICHRYLQLFVNDRLRNVPLDCIVQQTTKEGERSCGSLIKCP